MPEHIRCASCETTLLGFRAFDPKPIGRDDCPNCGAAEFTRFDDAADS